METRALLHRLLYDALLAIRLEGHEAGHKPVFHLADLFHTIPLHLETVAQGQSTYDEVLRWLTERAEEKGCSEWLVRAIRRQHDTVARWSADPEPPAHGAHAVER